ncbi:B12-binding domain-containing radical SAM protein [Geomonas oryzisoli]|uniref:B12-binding domain-containing radical SAM protein n=1 Tax=Geomonas oryzisoli TaxID=2847992 RepID=A0ABX8J337_9BACT|nr:radical SAM protein [Geomonas oryzisoli]QWV92815.1 B12-binding domain-containing radical SAM protein [Geomonas oryzisoli]
MKIIYIFPPLGHAGTQVRSMPLMPPVLEYLAGLTSSIRPDAEIRLINANVERFEVDDLRADVVGISILTHQSSWAYRTADRLRARGVKVMLGGPHPSVLPDEAKQHADSVVVGEAESVLATVLEDVQRDELQPFYHGQLLPVDGAPFPRRDLAPGYVFRSFFTSRGCPYDCKFCATPELHGGHMRYRPIPEVIADLGSCKHKMWFCTDADSWGPSVPRYTELFREMATSLPGIHWVGETSIASVQHQSGEEMLRWARRSGLMQVWIGWESFSDATLREYGATPKMLEEREEALKKIRANGIDVVLFIMLGSKNESLDEYQRVLEMCDRLAVTPHPVMVVPYPGTAMYQELREDTLHFEEWDYYDGMHSILTQHGGDNRAHEEALKRLWVYSFTWPRILRRLKALPLKGFPNAHIASGIVQAALRKAFLEFRALETAKAK